MDDEMEKFLQEVEALLKRYKRKVVGIVVAAGVVDTSAGAFMLGENMHVVSNNARAGLDILKIAASRATIISAGITVGGN